MKDSDMDIHFYISQKYIIIYLMEANKHNVLGKWRVFATLILQTPDLFKLFLLLYSFLTLASLSEFNRFSQTIFIFVQKNNLWIFKTPP